MVVRQRKFKKFVIKKNRRGFVTSVENPNVRKSRGTAFIAQSSGKPNQNFVVRSPRKKRPIGYAKTEAGAFKLAIKKGKRKAVFLD